ncbi:hypothetical protein COR50_20735 [Chitinophaga caeni]|uniref:Uncharacterized protein n=1 Tax=Chitinophaga caeni TaxID=2029983 RepID=A0A291QZN5_9BACT|nr:hypothetical protein COR50_20735 [Chitinophaga caeni]
MKDLTRIRNHEMKDNISFDIWAAISLESVNDISLQYLENKGPVNRPGWFGMDKDNNFLIVNHKGRRFFWTSGNFDIRTINSFHCCPTKIALNLLGFLIWSRT